MVGAATTIVVVRRQAEPPILYGLRAASQARVERQGTRHGEGRHRGEVDGEGGLAVRGGGPGSDAQKTTSPHPRDHDKNNCKVPKNR